MQWWISRDEEGDGCNGGSRVMEGADVVVDLVFLNVIYNLIYYSVVNIKNVESNLSWSSRDIVLIYYYFFFVGLLERLERDIRPNND